MKDLRIEQGDSADNLALIGEILGAAGINIEGLCLLAHGGRSVIHLAVEDALAARRMLEDSGVRVRKVSEVVVLHKDQKRITGKPGSFGGICRTLAENSIRIQFGYPAENNRFVFGLSNAPKARQLLGLKKERKRTHNQAMNATDFPRREISGSWPTLAQRQYD